MSLRRKTVLSVLMLLALAGAPRAAQAQVLYLTFQVPGTFLGTDFSWGDIVKYDNVAETSSLFFDASAHFAPGKIGGGLDGLEVNADGTFYFSTVFGGKIAGLKLDREDVILYDQITKTASVALNTTPYFSKKPRQIDAIKLLADGSWLLSTRQDAIFAGLAVDGGDVFRFDPVTETASLFFDADTLLNKDANLDAFDILPDGRYIFSIFKQRKLGPNKLPLKGSDLAFYDPVTGETGIYFDHNDIADWRGKHKNIRGVGTDGGNPPPVIPEPFSASLFGLGLGALGWARRRQQPRPS